MKVAIPEKILNFQENRTEILTQLPKETPKVSKEEEYESLLNRILSVLFFWLWLNNFLCISSVNLTENDWTFF